MYRTEPLNIASSQQSPHKHTYIQTDTNSTYTHVSALTPLPPKETILITSVNTESCTHIMYGIQVITQCISTGYYRKRIVTMADSPAAWGGLTEKFQKKHAPIMATRMTKNHSKECTPSLSSIRNVRASTAVTTQPIVSFHPKRMRRAMADVMTACTSQAIIDSSAHIHRLLTVRGPYSWQKE